jgi:ABC-type transporter Mla maintaining outer membrane lipid asymmetry permease subunit MlaE
MAEGGTKGVGRATTESVMVTSITILVVNFFLTRVVFSLIKGWL